MMNSLHFPKSEVKKIKAYERVIAQLLSKTETAFPIEIKHKDIFLSDLIFHINSNESKFSRVQCKWGIIDNPVLLLESIRSEKWEINGVHQFFQHYYKKRKEKKSKKISMDFRDFIEKLTSSFPFDKDSFSSVNELIDYLTFNPLTEDIEYVDITTGKTELFNTDTVISKLQNIEAKNQDIFLTALSSKIRKNLNNCNTAMKLQERLNLYGLQHDIESYIIDFEYYEYLGIGIKIQIGACVYLFDFEGNLKELEDFLKEEIDEHANDLVSCPFCEKIFTRTKIREMSSCLCGAVIENEQSRDMSGWTRSLDFLWDKACHSLNIEKPKDHKSIYIDDYFSNIVFLRQGKDGWRTWIYTLPWKKKICSNLQSKQFLF